MTDINTLNERTREMSRIREEVVKVHEENTLTINDKCYIEVGKVLKILNP